MTGTVYFTREHEWLRVDGDTGAAGISNYAQEQLGDVVYVELPEIGRTFKLGDSIAVVESVKAASDIYTPVSGEVVAVNDAVAQDPSLINSDPQGDGWLFKLKLTEPAETTKLMNEDDYRSYVEG